MKNIIIGLILLVLVGAGAFVFLGMNDSFQFTKPEAEEPATLTVDDDTVEEEEEPSPFQVVPQGTNPEKTDEVIGTSANGTAIKAYHYGTGDTEILFVGGIHSAFAPNTVAVMDEFITALKQEAIDIPENLKVTIIPNLNPDASGQPDTLASRLNANEVDLNRNFDCDWSATGVWRSSDVSGGSSAFSEPEAKALRDYVEGNNIAAAVVYYAADGGVYASNCGGSLDSEIASLTSTYAEAAGYTANEEFDAYTISGDATNWMAKIGVPAIGVLLSDYTDSEWTKNMAGIEAVLTEYGDETVTETDEE